MMRAGDEFSQTNKKLKLAVFSFIEWLVEQVGYHQFPPAEEFGWVLEKKGDNKIRLGFKSDRSGWLSVTANSDEEQRYQIVEFCATLAGNGGEKLLSWLEQEVQERERMFKGLEEVLRIIRVES